MEPLFEITLTGDPPVAVTASALLCAWGDAVPDLAARALDLAVGGIEVVFREPTITVRRIR